MNILVFSWRDPKHKLAGGAEQVMHEHMKGWVKEGHSVTLFSSLTKDTKQTEYLDGIKIVRSGNQYLGVQIKAFFYYLKNKNNFDFVVDQFHGIPFFTPLYVTKPKLAVLQEVTKEVWFKNPLRFPLNLIIGILGYISEPLVFLFYQNCKFIVGSNSAKDDLIKFGIKEKNITVVPHGIILPKIIPKHKLTNPKMITYFGPLTADKGIMDAITTFNILNKIGDYSFCIIGRPETDSYYKKVMQKVKKFNLKEKIEFYKRPTDEEKFEILSRSFLFINPSIREGWGLVNIEANAVGTPVIAYPSQGLVDSVCDNLSGVITKNSTSGDLVMEIEKLVKDKVKYQRLSTGAKQWASRFAWNKSRKESLKLIEKLVDGS
ncbi:MAG: glycosyltransferase family 4 protein [Candidatus Woesearchaeota archaeon]|jgi:glycosyltransferase involved in cell wall biosynthesis